MEYMQRNHIQNSILIRSQLHVLLWTLFHKLNNPLPYLVQQVLGSLRPVIIAMLQVWSIIPAFDARSIQQPLLLTFFVRCVGYREGYSCCFRLIRCKPRLLGWPDHCVLTSTEQQKN